MPKKEFAAGDPFRTPLGKLAAVPQTRNWWGGGSLPSPQGPHHYSRHSASIFGPLRLRPPSQLQFLAKSMLMSCRCICICYLLFTCTVCCW